VRVVVLTTGSQDLPPRSLAEAIVAAGPRVEAGALRRMYQGRQLLEPRGTLLLLRVALDRQFLRLSKMRRVVVTLLQVLTKLQILITPSTASSLKQLHWQVRDHQVHLLQLRPCQQQQTNLLASFPLPSRFPLPSTLLVFAPQSTSPVPVPVLSQRCKCLSQSSLQAQPALAAGSQVLNPGLKMLNATVPSLQYLSDISTGAKATRAAGLTSTSNQCPTANLLASARSV